MHRHHENEYEMYLRDCNWLCVFFSHRERKMREEGNSPCPSVCAKCLYLCVYLHNECVCVLPWSTPWATASTWQRGLSSDGTSSDTAETDSGYYGNKTIKRQMKRLYKFPLKLHAQYYFHVIHTKICPDFKHTAQVLVD